MNQPEIKTVYVPVKVEDEFPNGECVMISKTQDMLVGYPAVVNVEIQADDEHQILRYITHWLKEQQLITFTPEEYNKHIQDVIDDSLNTATEKAEVDIEEVMGQKTGYVEVDKESIINTSQQTFKKFEV
jgi:glycine cleavage system regulatory protein